MTSPRSSVSGDIVVGVDGSASSEHAVMWAADEARLQHRGLTLAHASRTLSTQDLAWLSAGGVHPHQVNEEIRVEAERVIQRAHSLAQARSPETAIETIVVPQDARSLLLDLSGTAAMTVVGTRGHGRVAGLLLGSVSGALVRHAHRPVTVVRPAPTSGRGVLIAADGSEDSLLLAEHACREASLHGLPLTVVHCLWDGLVGQERWTTVPDTDPAAEEARARVGHQVAAMREKFPDVDMQTLVTRGAIDACLVDLSSRYDLLVIGRPPRPLLLRLTLSSLTAPVVEHAHCPVLVVPSEVASP